MKPTAFDIIHAIELVHTGDVIDPVMHPDGCWTCVVYDANGQPIANGEGLSAGDAMGLAWVHAFYPDGLIDGRIPENNIVPYVVPNSWRFELEWVEDARQLG
jgi:hypothetical protein